MSEFVLLRDLVKDDRGNYYIGIKQVGNELHLVNAFVEFSFRRLLGVDGDLIENYDRQYTGKVALDTLRSWIKREKVVSYELDQLKQKYTLKFIDSAEFERNPSITIGE